MRFIGLFAAGMMAASLAACGGSVVDPHDLEALASAEAKWRARPFADYSYEIRTVCFCPPELSQWTRVSVRAGVVVSVIPVDPDPQFPITNPQYWDPIDSLFAGLRTTMQDPSSNVYLDAIIVSYDPQLGYPTNIEYRTKRNVLDGGSTHTLRSVQPLP